MCIRDSTNSFSGMWLTDELRQRAVKEKQQADEEKQMKKEILEDLDMYGV